MSKVWGDPFIATQKAPSGLLRLGAAVPSEYYIDLEFTRPLYSLDGVAYTDISQVPGYTYSDLTDNLPVITSDGYLSNTTDQTDLRVDSLAITNESFTIFLVVEHLDAAGSTEFLCSFNDGTTTNHITFARGSTGFATLSGSSGGVGFSASHAMGTSSGLRGYAIRRNVGSNTWTLFSKNTDTTNANSASGAASVPSGIDRIDVGSRLGSNRPDARIKLVQMRRELLTNAEVTARLDGLWSGLS